MNIMLTGYRGTGKTAVGRLLCRRLKMRLIDTDSSIEKSAGMKIPEIVEKFGWKGFRELESREIKSAMRKNNSVISVGGGGLTENRIKIRKKSLVILLTASPGAIKSRIKKSGRPSITGKGSLREIGEVIKKREKKYLGMADAVVDTTEITPSHAAGMIALLAIGKWKK